MMICLEMFGDWNVSVMGSIAWMLIGIHDDVGGIDRMLLAIDYLVPKEHPSSKRSDAPIKEGLWVVGSRS